MARGRKALSMKLNLRPFSSHWLMKYIEKIKPGFWMTVGNNIFYPSDIGDVHYDDDYHRDTIQHERVHVAQYDKYGVPLFLFLYFLVPTMRWRFERKAWLVEIASGVRINYIVDTLRRHYWILVPKRIMRNWFVKESARRGLKAYL